MIFLQYDVVMKITGDIFKSRLKRGEFIYNIIRLAETMLLVFTFGAAVRF